MKKTFQLRIEGRHPDRLVEAIKHEIRKYIRRERRRDLPEGADFWDFDCKFGSSANDASVVHLAEITTRIDTTVREGGQQFYVEILARHGHRTPRPVADAPAED